MSRSEWIPARLAECVATINSGVSVNSDDRPRGPGEVGVLKTSAISAGSFKAYENKVVAKRDLSRVAEPVLGGSILLSRLNTPQLVGESCYIEADDPSLFLPDRLWQIRVDSSRVDARWLSYALREPRVASEIKGLATGTSGSMKNIARSSFLGISVSVPPIREQRRIAEILGALGDQISSTEQITAKMSASRIGLTERLITQEFPNATLGSVLLGTPSNGIYKPAHLIGRGALLIGQTAINSDRRVVSALARRAVVTSTEAQRFSLIPGDILVSRVFATLEGVGQPALIEHLDEPAVYESNMMRLRCDDSKADPFFVFQSLLTSAARAHIVSQANLSNQASISQSVLTGFPLWLPSMDQQLRVGQAIRSVEAGIGAERARLEKLQAVKSGLLADLLTGRVRVPSEVAS